MKYMVAQSSSKTELMTSVNHLLEEGWRPQGGISTDRSDTNGVYRVFFQALVKE